MFRFLIVLCCAFAFLLPSAAQAAPVAQQKPCDPRGLVQNLLSNLRPDLFISEAGQTSLPINGIDITLHVCSTSLESATATRMLRLIAQVLPAMSEFSGLRYDGPRDRWILVVSEQELPPNAAGSFTDADSIIRLTPDSSDWTVMHEAAHYWANNRNFSSDEPWMAEGYAEYLTERAMIDLHRPERMRAPLPICNTLPLMQWSYNLRAPFGRCAYDLGGAVFRDLRQQAGDDTFRAVVGELANNDTIRSPTLLDRLERLSGKDLSPLMRERVFPVEANELLDFRRQNWDAYDQATALAQQSGIALPGWIERALFGWDFDSTWPWLTALGPFLQAQSAYAARCAELGLDCGGITGAPETIDALTAATDQANSARTRLDQYAPLDAAARSLGVEVPQPIRAAVAADQPESEALVIAALETIQHGKTVEQVCQSLSISCVPAWRELWNQGNIPDATAAISSTASVVEDARRVDTMCTRDIIRTCHDLWVPQLEQGALITATQRLNQLDALLRDGSAREKACGAAESACHQLWGNVFVEKGVAAAREQLSSLARFQASARATEELCKDVRDTCQRIWQAALQAGGIEGSAKTLADLNSLMQRAETIEHTCAAQGYDCAQTWRGRFRQGAGIEQTQALLGRLNNDVLPTLRLAHTQITQPPSGIVEKMEIPFAQPQTQLATVQQALDRSDIDQALALAQQILAEHQRALWIRYGLLIALIVLPLLLIIAFGLAKRRWPAVQRLQAKPVAAAQQTPADDLLASLLASPPAQKKGKR